jgi:hypothetical protein
MSKLEMSKNDFINHWVEQLEELKTKKSELDETDEDYLNKLESIEVGIEWLKTLLSHKIAERDLMHSQVNKNI